MTSQQDIMSIMDKVLFRGKRISDGIWVYGFYIHRPQPVCIGHSHPYCIWVPANNPDETTTIVEVDPATVGQFTSVTDKNGKKIFEGDIVQYNTDYDFDCQSIVKFGEYNQDGSAGEYSARKCIGFYVDVDNYTCPDWCEYDPDFFPKYLNQQNILEVASYCEVIGNIHDNPEILKGGGDNG